MKIIAHTHSEIQNPVEGKKGSLLCLCVTDVFKHLKAFGENLTKLKKKKKVIVLLYSPLSKKTMLSSPL